MSVRFDHGGWEVRWLEHYYGHLERHVLAAGAIATEEKSRATNDRTAVAIGSGGPGQHPE
jgi:hypothetical protein